MRASGKGTDLRLAVPVAIAWAVLAALIGVPGILGPAAISLWVAAVLSVGMAVVLRSARARSLLVPAALVCAVIALPLGLAALGQPARQPEFLLEAANAGRFITAEVRLDQTIDARVHAGGTPDPVSGHLVSVTVGDRSAAADIPVLAFDVDRVSDPRAREIGATLAVGGTLKATDPGDDSAFLLFAARPPVLVRGAPWQLAWADGLRAGFRATARGLPGDGGDLLPGLSIGDTGAVSAGLDTAMKATSLSHLTAVSGANCAVIIAIVLFLASWMGLPRAWRIAVSVTVLVGFVVLVTPEPSVLRAAVMAALVLAAVLGGRPAGGLPTLALASLMLLSVDPWLCRSYGFVLSVLATGGLLVLSGPLSRAIARLLPARLAMVVAIPLAAQLACQPVLILLNPSIPTYGVVANLLAEPAAPIATVAGLAACLVGALSPPVGLAIAWLAWLPSAWIAAVATFFAGLPGANLPWLGGAIGVAATAVIAGVLLVAVLTANPRLRRIAAATLCLVLVGYLGVAAGNAVRVRLSRPGDWQIAACDIGQGDAVLVRSAGRIALIDTGPDPALLSSCLSTLGIERIDLLVLSHWDLDHVGGTSAVFGRVDRAFIGPSDGSAAAGFGRQLADHGAEVSQVSEGLAGRLGDLGWEVLWPKAQLGSVEPGNDASVTMRFTAAGACLQGCLSALFLGDLGDEPQARMMGANRIGPVDVVKVAHHGSADQDPLLYERLRAAVGVISVGEGNDYGHPTGSLLGILASVGTLATRTDVEGMTLLSPRPDGSVSVWTERPMPAGKLTRH